MALKLKPIHNLRAYLEKSDVHPQYDHAIDLLTSSQYHTSLFVNPVISVAALNDFWAHAEEVVVDDEVVALTSTVATKKVTISAAILSQDLALMDTDCPTSFGIGIVHQQFLECDYLGNLQNKTLFKTHFHPQHKFLFHTILQCLSPKSTSWDQMPKDMQMVMYSVLTGQKFCFSKLVFHELVINHNNQKASKFLLYPRFLMVCLNKQLGNVCHMGALTHIKSLDKQTMSRLNTAAKSAAGDDQEEQPILKEPTSQQPAPAKVKAAPKKPSKSKPPPKHKPKMTSLEPVEPEVVPASPRQQTTAEPSSQQLLSPQPQPAPHSSSQQEDVVTQREPTPPTEASLDPQMEVLSPRDDPLLTPPTSSLSPLQNITHLLSKIGETCGTTPTSPAHLYKEKTPTGAGHLSPLLTPRAEDDVIPGGSAPGDGLVDGASTSDESSTEPHQDGSGNKTPSAATADEVPVTEAGIPQNQEQGDLDTSGLIPGQGITDDLIRESDDPVKSGDGSFSNKELTAKITKIEADVGQIKDLVMQLLSKDHPAQSNPRMASSTEDHPNTPPTTQQPPASTSKTGDFNPPLDPATLQSIIGDALHPQITKLSQTLHSYITTSVHSLQISLDNKFLEIRKMAVDNANHLTKLSGVAPPPPWNPQADEAKKGEEAALLQAAKIAKARQDDRHAKEVQKMKQIRAKNLEAQLKAALDQQFAVAAAEANKTQKQLEASLPNPPTTSQITPTPTLTYNQGRQKVLKTFTRRTQTRSQTKPSPKTTASQPTTDQPTTTALPTDQPTTTAQITTDQPTTDPPDQLFGTDEPLPSKVSSPPKTEPTQPSPTKPKTKTSPCKPSVVKPPTDGDDDDDDDVPIVKLFSHKRKRVIREEEITVSPTTYSPTKDMPEATDTQTQQNKELAILDALTEAGLAGEELSAAYAEQLKKLDEEEEKEYKEQRDSCIAFLLAKGNYKVEKFTSWTLTSLQTEVEKLNKRIKAEEKKKANAARRNEIVEILHHAGFGTMAAIRRWKDMRLYDTFHEWKKTAKEEQNKANVSAPQPSTAISSRKKQKPSINPEEMDILKLVASGGHVSSEVAEAYRQQIIKRDMKLFSGLMEEEKVLLTENKNPEEYAAAEAIVNLTTKKAKVQLVHMPTLPPPPPPLSTTVTELPSSQKQASQSTQQQQVKKPARVTSKIVRWYRDNKTNRLVLVRENGAVQSTTEWYRVLELPDQDLFCLMSLNLEDEDPEKTNMFQLDIKGQIKHKLFK